jgi:hypothetical protein
LVAGSLANVFAVALGLQEKLTLNPASTAVVVRVGDAKAWSV